MLAEDYAIIGCALYVAALACLFTALFARMFRS